MCVSKRLSKCASENLLGDVTSVFYTVTLVASGIERLFASVQC